MKIEFSRFKFELETTGRLRLGAFFENTLRGMIGAHLHRLCCSNALEKCESCADSASCLYSYLYNTPAAKESKNLSNYKTLPHPYIFYFPRNRLIFEKGDRVIFYLTLFGRALNYLSYYVHAVSGVCRDGFGIDRTPLRLAKVEAVYGPQDLETIYTVEDPFLNSFRKQSLCLETALHPVLEVNPPNCDAEPALRMVKLSFNSAFRVKENEKLLSAIGFPTIIKSLLRRFSNIAYFHCGRETPIDFKKIIDMAGNVEVVDSKLEWFEYDRYSLRQRAKMKLGGLIGEITFKNASKWIDLLKLGEIIHLGKNTSFGFGKYELEVINNVDQL